MEFFFLKDNSTPPKEKLFGQLKFNCENEVLRELFIYTKVTSPKIQDQKHY